MDDMRHVEKLAQLLPGGWNLDLVDGICSLTRGYMMCAWSNTTDTGDDARHLLNGAAFAEALEAAQLGYLQIGVLNLAVIVQEDLYLPMPFQPRDWVYGYS
jgi:hypothetical protein